MCSLRKRFEKIQLGLCDTQDIFCIPFYLIRFCRLQMKFITLLPLMAEVALLARRLLKNQSDEIRMPLYNFHNGTKYILSGFQGSLFQLLRVTSPCFASQLTIANIQGEINCEVVGRRASQLVWIFARILD